MSKKWHRLITDIAPVLDYEEMKETENRFHCFSIHFIYASPYFHVHATLFYAHLYKTFMFNHSLWRFEDSVANRECYGELKRIRSIIFAADELFVDD